MKKKLIKSTPVTIPPSPQKVPQQTSWFGNSLFDSVTDEEIDKLFLDSCPKKEDNKELKCECGADKVYDGKPPAHSDWCAK